ncbi:MAG: GyrI-like domain-containing protein [bacterium]|nr:GyrI-like domain-containing protein [bacterium]
MPKFHVERSIVINARPEDVYQRVADYGTWTTWSPWLCSEPEAQVTVSDDANSVGSLYSWEGEVVGAGEIEHKSLVEGSRIEDEIRFLKPMKSVSNVGFAFEPASTEQGDATRVTWNMDGSLPWFLFWMTSQLESFIGMDYDRGLKMLKEWTETGHVQSSTKVHGIQKMGPFQVLGVRGQAKLSEIGSAMDSAFAKATQLLEQHGLPVDGEKISVYHKFDAKQETFEFTSGYLFGSPVDSVPSGLDSWSMPEMDTFRVDHIGSYDHLGNAWSAAMQHARSKKMKQSKIGTFELYKNDPSNTPPEHLLTEIYLPLK